MKKTLLLLLAAMFTLTGCGNKDKPDSPNDPGTEEHNGEIPNGAYEIFEKTILVEGSTDPYHRHNFDQVTNESLKATCTSHGKTVLECSSCKCKYSVTTSCSAHNFDDNNVCQDCGFSIQFSTGLEYVKNEGIYYAVRGGTRYQSIAPGWTDYEDTYLVSGIGNCSSDQIVIPSMHAGCKVIGVLDNAFKGNDFIKKVTFTQNNVIIGKEAFNYCINLQDVVFDCDVDTIGDYAFANCSKLKNMNLPASIARVNANSFSNCPGLKNKIVSKNGLTIFNTAILSGQEYTGNEIELGYEYTSVGTNAFLGNQFLTKLTVKNPFLYLGDSSFGNCPNLIDVDLGQATSNFFECGTIKTPDKSYYPTYSKNTSDAKKNEISPFTNSAITNVICGNNNIPLFFKVRNSVKSLFIKDKVMYYPLTTYYNQFNNLNLALFGNLETLHLFDTSYNDISSSILFKISSEYQYLKSENDPNYKDHLKNLILEMCEKSISFDHTIENVEIQDTVHNKELNISLLKGNKINNLRVHSKLDSIRGSTLNVNIENFYFDFTKDEYCLINQYFSAGVSIYTITENVFFSDGQFGNELVFENGKEIGDRAFADNKKIESVTIRGNIEKIGEMAFSDCTNLKTVIIEGNVKEIGKGAFEKCPIENLEIYDSIEKIGNGAFNLKKVKTNITIENGCKYVGATNNPYLFFVGFADDVPETIRLNSRCKVICEESLTYKHVSTIYFDENILSVPFSLNYFEADHLIWNSNAPMSQYLTVGVFDFSQNISSVDFNYCKFNHFHIPENSKLTEFKSFSTSIVNMYFPSFDICQQIAESQYHNIGKPTHVYIDNVEVSYGTLEIPEGIETLNWYFYDAFNFYRLILPSTYNDTKQYNKNYFKQLRDVLNRSSIDNSVWAREVTRNSLGVIIENEIRCSNNEEELGNCLKYSNEWYFYEYLGEYSTTKYSGGSNVITPDTPFKYSITNNLFNGVNIESVVLSSSVKKLESYAFDSNSKLTSLTIREGLEAMESKAIYCCNNLTELILPASLLDIAKNAVYFTLDKAFIDTLYIRGSEESRTNLGSPITNLPNVVWDYVPEE